MRWEVEVPWKLVVARGLLWVHVPVGLGCCREQEHMTVGSRSRAELSGSGYSFRFESETSSAVRTAAHQAIQKVVAGIGV